MGLARFFGLIVASLSSGTLTAQQAFVPHLDGIDGAALGAALPPDWRARPVRGVRPARTRIVEVGGRKALRFEAHGEAIWTGRALDQPLDPDEGHLAWTWRVDGRLAAAALRDPVRDDAPARLAVVFGRLGLFGRSRVLFYTWGEQEPKHGTWTNPSNGRFGVLVVRNAQDPVGEWITEVRDLGADYRRVFGGDPPPVYGVGYMIDAEQTGGVQPPCWFPSSGVSTHEQIHPNPKEVHCEPTVFCPAARPAFRGVRRHDGHG